MVDESGGWGWCWLSPWLSNDTSENIVAIMQPRLGLGADSPGWRWEDNQRARRHLTGSDRCSVCDNGTESIEHVLRLCPQARQVWETMITPGKLSVFESLPFDTWLLQCFNNIDGIRVGNDIWNTRFAMICWLIWKTRCATVFGSVGLHGVVLARYNNIVAAEFAATHACRAVESLRIAVAVAKLHSLRNEASTFTLMKPNFYGDQGWSLVRL
ncbi:hypothetical protein V6N11_065096 [Hibiscus sabdariffa]|uniref:Reverse transcriptase zinc-binding domain-containing protein n=1 Tax=Hibiscus sabdariffa TaxID=183260 RepID=A0ABR2SIT7_9ROSI